MFLDILGDLVEDNTWKNEFLETSSKPRFMYRRDTRRRIIERANSLNEVAARKRVKEVWSDHFDDAGGVFKAVREGILAAS